MLHLAKNQVVENESNNAMVSEEFISNVKKQLTGNHPSSITFRRVGKQLQIEVTTINSSKSSLSTKSYADAKLIDAVIDYAIGKSTAFDNFKAEEHEVKASETDERIELLQDFLNSNYRFRQTDDFVTNRNEHYMNLEFVLNSNVIVRFCLKRDGTLEDMVNKAILA